MGKPRSDERTAGVHHYSRSERPLNKPMIGIVSLLILLFLFFIGFLRAPFEPFETLRNFWVSSAMTSMNHQYLAKWFFSDAEIQKILTNNQVASMGNSNPSLINTRGTSGNNGMELLDVSQKGFKGYLLKINDPARVKVGATRFLGKTGERAEDIAAETGAVAVINGGEFNDPQGNGNGGKPLGILISGGKILYKDRGKMYDIIGMDRNNVLVLGHYSLSQIQKMGIRDAVTFSPFLVVNGQRAITRGDGGWGIAPRTAIGQLRDGTILMLVIDGRQIGSLGATLKEVQDIMLEYGAYNVANLDGGASTILYYQHEIINHPSSQYGERRIPSFFIVK